MQPKTSVIKINRFNSTDYQVVTRVDKGGALHVYHQRRQPPGKCTRTRAHTRAVQHADAAGSVASFPVLQCAATLASWISLEKPAAAPTSVSLATATRRAPAAAAPASVWAATESPAKVRRATRVYFIHLRHVKGAKTFERLQSSSLRRQLLDCSVRGHVHQLVFVQEPGDSWRLFWSNKQKAAFR